MTAYTNHMAPLNGNPYTDEMNEKTEGAFNLQDLFRSSALSISI